MIFHNKIDPVDMENRSGIKRLIPMRNRFTNITFLIIINSYFENIFMRLVGMIPIVLPILYIVPTTYRGHCTDSFVLETFIFTCFDCLYLYIPSVRVCFLYNRYIIILCCVCCYLGSIHRIVIKRYQKIKTYYTLD